MDAERLNRIELENSLLRLDMEWERERQGLLRPFRGNEPAGPPNGRFVFAALWFLGWLLGGAAMAGNQGNLGAGLLAGGVVGAIG
jgi:hypothetical protein